MPFTTTCDGCPSPRTCGERGYCRLDVEWSDPVAPRPPVTLPSDVPPPGVSIVWTEPADTTPEAKPPAPSNEPKHPTGSTMSEMTTPKPVTKSRTVWAGALIVVLNALALFFGLADVDTGPILDAILAGDWAHVLTLVMGVLVVVFRIGATRILGRR